MIEQEIWVRGFLAAAYLFTGRYDDYAQARDEYLKQRAANK